MSTLRLVPTAGAPLDVTKDAVLIGREPSCDLVVADGSISRRHARIEKRGEAWFVIDQASANGTFLDSQRVSEAPLRNGQELRFGAVPFKVEIEVPSSSAETILQAVPGFVPPAATKPMPAVTPAAPPAPPTPPPPPPAAAAAAPLAAAPEPAPKPPVAPKPAPPTPPPAA